MSKSVNDLVTVVIPALNEEAFIATCLESMLAQQHTNLQIIVADGRSSDATRDIVMGYARRDRRVELIDNPKRGVAAALNVGLDNARGRYIARVDAHSMISPDYISRIVDHFSTGAWSGVGGRIHGLAYTPTGVAAAAADASVFGVGNAKHHYGDQVQLMEHVTYGAYRVAVARAYRGWDENVPTNEDFEFDYRLTSAGRLVLFDPNIVVHWTCRQDLRAVFDQYRRYGASKPRVIRKHPRSLRLRQTVAPALVLWTAVVIALGALQPLVLLGLAPYTFALTSASLLTARHISDRRARLMVPAVFAAMHFGWGIGFITGVLRLAKRSRPERVVTVPALEEMAA